MKDFLARHTLGLALVSIFCVFFAVFASLEFQFNGLRLQDDAYYHIRHSLSYCTGTPEIKMPAYSTMATHSADLYTGYHALMCPFTAFFPFGGSEASFNGAKIFNSLLNALFFVFFFFANYSLLSKRYGCTPRVLKIAALSCLYLVTVSHYFFDRLYFIRPEIFGIAAVVAAYYAIEKKHWRMLALVAFLLPFFYSVSFIVLFPPLVFAGAMVVYYRRIFYFDAWLPFFTSFGALAAGILLRPDAFNYVYNAYYIHLLAVLNRFANSAIVEGSELYAPDRGLVFNFLWLIPLVIYTGIVLYRIVAARSLRKTFAFGDFYLLVSVLLLLPLYLLIERGAEYFAPFMALLAGKCFVLIRNAADAWKNEPVHPPKDSGPLALLIEAGRTLRNGMSSYARPVALFFTVWLTAMFGHIYFNLSLLIRDNPPSAYEAAARYMAEHSNEDDIVFNFGIEQYAKLAYYNNKDRYILGMGATFTYMHDKGLYFEFAHAVSNTPICPARTCTDNTKDLYTALKDDFHAAYIFSDAEKYEKFRPYFAAVESDPRFRMVYNDPQNQGIKIYKVE